MKMNLVGTSFDEIEVVVVEISSVSCQVREFR